MALLREALPVKKLTAYFCLNWKTVKEIDKQSLQAKLGGPNLSNVELRWHGGFILLRINLQYPRPLFVGRDAGNPLSHGSNKRPNHLCVHLECARTPCS